MQILNYVSFLLIILFLSSYFLKLAVLYKNYKIKANVLGKAGKEKNTHIIELIVKISSFTGVCIWFLETVFSFTLAKFIRRFYFVNGFTYSGLFIKALGVAFFMLAAVSMKSSWRVGIDKQSKTALITGGIYKYSRNPAFVGFDFMFIGVFLTFPDILTVLVMTINMIAFHLLILQEERHLTEAFGKEYIKYKQITPRYLFFNK